MIHCSICNGEQVTGFRDKETGHFEEVILVAMHMVGFGIATIVSALFVGRVLTLLQKTIRNLS